MLGGGETGGMERVREALGILHQPIGIPDVCQAEPEDGPSAVYEASITMFEVPGQRQTGSGAKLSFERVKLCSSAVGY